MIKILVKFSGDTDEEIIVSRIPNVDELLDFLDHQYKVQSVIHYINKKNEECQAVVKVGGYRENGKYVEQKIGNIKLSGI